MTNDAHWHDKVAIVLAHAGATVVMAARNAERLEQAVGTLTAAGHSATGLVTDVTDDGQVQRLIDETKAKLGRIDALFNNAGQSTRGSALETTPAQFQALWETNFLSAVRCTRAAAPHLLAARGHVVCIGSLASKTAGPHLGAYPASKFPLAAYTQQLRLEVGPKGLHVLLVCPGPIAREDAGSRYDATAATLPLGARRPGGGVRLKGLDPQHLAQAILRACVRRQPELVMPGKAKLLFALAQLSPGLGDRIIRRLFKE